MKVPKSVYRRFKEKQWASDLLNGVVWLPTFKSIRDPEHPRSDPREGTAQWSPPSLLREDPEEDRRLLLKELKRTNFMDMGDDFDGVITLTDCNVITTAQGFVFCTSRNAKLKQFGDHCVRIQNPQLFANLVFTELHRRYGDGVTGAHGWVPYGRESNGRTAPNEYFAGTANNHSEEEYRFVFVPPGDLQELEPVRLEIPWVSRLCTAV